MPPELHECEDSRPTVRAKCFIAYTGSSGSLRDLVFEAVELEGLNVQGQWSSDTKWEDIRWDLETSIGGNQPRDMLFGFQVFSMTPMFRKGGLQAALERLASREWTGFKRYRQCKSRHVDRNRTSSQSSGCTNSRTIQPPQGRATAASGYRNGWVEGRESGRAHR